MSEHSLILEFYKPTYNLDFDYNNDGGLDLNFTNIKGEFFMTMENSYDNIYFEDEDCEFSKGEMLATVDLGDLVERIANGEYRNTNGKAPSDWISRLVGDYTKESTIEFDGKCYADGSLFWDDFFKEMPKDEIKDFLKFCEDYLYLPNIEVDTVSNKWDFENGKVELKSNDKWGIGISDDYNIIVVDEFTCDSADAFVAYDVASSESEEDDFYESKKSIKKSLKESKKYVSDVADDLMISFEDILNVFEEYGYGKKEAKDFYDSKWEDVTDAFDEMAELAVMFELEDWNESKKCAKKSLKEKLNDSGDVRFNDIYSCDLVNVLTVTVYDKELYEKLREEDLVLYQKGVYEQIDWKSFQDEISYLKEDIYASDDFDVKFTLSNGVLIIDVLDNTDKDIIMEYKLEPKIVN